MEIQINGVLHYLDINAARAAGVLTRDIKHFVIEMDENEVATLLAILDKIGGSPNDTAGNYARVFRKKLLKLGRVQCDKSLELAPVGNGLCFR